jgi:hypothetical protein
MAHEPLIETLLKVGGGHSCEILKWLAKICEICPDMGVGHYAAVGQMAAAYIVYLPLGCTFDFIH